MGVKSLWQLIQLAARPVRLEALSGERVAIDASIWLYHFLKAMRDQTTGEMMPNAHLIGFIRRICKLLFFNMRPIFVFDGAAPELKKRTARLRRDRREGVEKEASKTKQEILHAKLKKYAIQMINKTPEKDGIKINKTPKKPDEYQLPESGVSKSLETDTHISWEKIGMGSIESWDDVDLDGIDIESVEFMSLPKNMQQELLRELRIRSRQTSWDRLNEMMENSSSALDFSQMQIQNLVKRNQIWQKWDSSIKDEVEGKTLETRRIASQYDREYILVKNTDEATWSLKTKKDEYESVSVPEVVCKKPVERVLKPELTKDFLEQSSSEDESIEHVRLDKGKEPEIIFEVPSVSKPNFYIPEQRKNEQQSPILESKDLPTTVKEEPELKRHEKLNIESDVESEPEHPLEIVNFEPEVKVKEDTAADEQVIERVDEAENIADEDDHFAEFVASIQDKPVGQVHAEIEQELNSLKAKYHSSKRDASTMTSDMIHDVKVLLDLFGIPYIDAPAEAEAQCAYLLQQGLVDGIITDDSDIFLFGGDNVYKNMFNQSKYVECFKCEDLLNYMRLNRRRFIDLAYLLGSDYCQGLPGVGPTTAFDILAEFDNGGSSCLKPFTEWMKSILDDENVSYSPFTSKYKKMAEKWFQASEYFSDESIREAYMNPVVIDLDKSIEWKIPDLHGIKRFIGNHLFWDNQKIDSLVLPVIKNISSGMKSSSMQKFIIPISTERIIPFKPSISECIEKLKVKDGLVNQESQKVHVKNSSSESESEIELPVKAKPVKKPTRGKRKRGREIGMRNLKNLYENAMKRRK